MHSLTISNFIRDFLLAYPKQQNQSPLQEASKLLCLNVYSPLLPLQLVL